MPFPLWAPWEIHRRIYGRFTTFYSTLSYPFWLQLCFQSFSKKKQIHGQDEEAILSPTKDCLKFFKHIPPSLSQEAESFFNCILWVMFLAFPLSTKGSYLTLSAQVHNRTFTLWIVLRLPESSLIEIPSQRDVQCNCSCGDQYLQRGEKLLHHRWGLVQREISLKASSHRDTQGVEYRQHVWSSPLSWFFHTEGRNWLQLIS